LAQFIDGWSARLLGHNEGMIAVPERLRPLLAPESPLQDLARRFAAAGYSLHLVGGSVRDALLGEIKPDGDLDLTTEARPDAVLELVRPWADHVWLQGKAYGTIGASRGEAPDDMRVEITTFRAEVYRPDSRKPTVTFSDSLETDLSRRDFTINAMALSLPDPALVDPYGGLDDLLAHRRLRTPLDPEISFLDDPLRMMRAARFMAGLGLDPDPALVTAATELAGRLEVVSAERIRDELSKLLVVKDPSPGLWFLVQTGLADEFLPELPGLALEQDPIHHHKDVLAHTIAVVAKTRPELIVRLAALLHDIGKPKTRSFGPEGVSFHLHDVVGARMAEERLRALRFPKETIEAVTQLVLLHLRFHTYKMGWTDKAIRRYVRDAGPLLDDLNHLVRCDCTTRNQAKARALGRRMDDLEARIDDLAQREELASIRPALDGHRVMELLGVPPGRVVGDALAMLLDARIDEGPMTEEQAERRLLAWGEERGLRT
jgi:poly(A) polymerase